jgi:anti-sigma-K factor RskA
MLAAEYVMGLLDGGEMLAVRRQALTDATLAGSIQFWERRLMPIVDLVPPVPPPLALWSRVDQSVNAAVRESAVDSTVVPLRPRPAQQGGAWRSVGLWRATTFASLALAAAFAAVAFLPQLDLFRRAAPPTAIAALAPLGGPAPAFLAELRTDGRILVSAVAPAAVPDGRDLELWLLTPGSQRPQSLGVLPSGGKSLLIGPPPPVGSQLLVSLEPRGGSPTGQPTGQVLYGGTLAVRSGT